MKYFKFIFYIACIINLNAQVNNVFDNLKHLTISEGLSHDGITSILEDSKGFIWFGTYSGINRYDGYKLKSFKNTPSKKILCSNRIRSLFEDKFHNIWVGTEKGITILNTLTNTFNEVEFYLGKSPKGNYKKRIIRKIFYVEKEQLIVAITENGSIQLFNEQYKFLGEHFANKDVNYRNISLYDGIKINNSHLALVSNIGLIDFNLKTKHYKNVLKKGIRSCNALTLLDKNKLFLAGSRGLKCIELSFFQNLVSYKLTNTLFKNNKFTSLALDAQDNLWLGHQREGLSYVKDIKSFFNKKNNKLKTFKGGLNILNSSKLYCTSKNKCWFGTYNSGAYCFDTKENPFKKLILGDTISKVPNLVEFDSLKLGLAVSYKNQSMTYDLITNTTDKFKLDILNKANYLFLDSKKDLWVNNIEKGFHRVKKGSSQVDYILENSVSFQKKIKKIRCITEQLGEVRKIWVGTVNNVYVYSVNEKNEVISLESLKINPNFENRNIGVRSIYADEIQNCIWIGTDDNGLYKVNNQEGVSLKYLDIEHYVYQNIKGSLPSNFVTSIIRLPNKELWIGTENGGICKVDESEPNLKFEIFTEDNGLSSNVVKAIVADDASNLWVATNNGLNKFDTQTLRVRQFKKSEGLPVESFFYEAFKMTNGHLVFSSNNGVLYFDPKDVAKTDEIPKFHFENLKIFNNTVQVNDTLDGKVVLKNSIANINKIELNYDQNVFSLDLLSLHYSNVDNYMIKYKLDPINKAWVTVISNKNTINYSGLQPGTYTLNVMVSNSLGEWSLPKKIQIVINPPYWKTTWAYCIYVILILLIGYLINRIIIKFYLLNHKIEIEKLEKSNQKEVNEAKLTFFANISHEIKTPLTLITSPINDLYERFSNNPELGEKLGLVLRQSKKINELIELVQDFRRSDANMLKMKYERFEFNSFINEVVNDFMYAVYNEKKELKLIVEENPIIVSADKNKIEKIFNNLLSNAIKYTNENDTIKVSYQTNDKDLIIIFEDTGKGISPVDLEHVFERFYQSSSNEKDDIPGAGIGLAFTKRLVEMHYGYINVESELGIGSKFIIKLPIIKEQGEQDSFLLNKIKLPKEKEVSVNNIVETKKWSEIIASGEFSESLIFYAEDNDEMRNYITCFLSQYFKVKSFKNGQECLNALEDEWPDLIISDIQMPELNGLDLCIQVKSDIKTSHIPFILLTALTNLKDHIQGIKDGADAYIKKPFNLERLLTTVEALLVNRKKMRERFEIGIPLTRDNINNRNDNAFLEKLYSLIDENLDNQEFDLKTLASELCLSKTTFYQKVNTLTNQTPFELIKNYRLKRASELLIQEKLSVNEVFMMTGFKSRTHFSTKFKEKFKVSPSKYAKKKEDDNKEI